MRNLLKVARAENNLSQANLADKLGVSRQTINSIETGRYIPSTVLALKLAKIFTKSVDDLFILDDTD